MDIRDKSILITGANRGIGRALVDEALRRGAKRIYAGTRGRLGATDARVVPLTLDVTDLAQAQRAAREIGSLDLLVNNAGIVLYDPLSSEMIEKHLAVNVIGSYKVTHAFLPLLERARGAIVNQLSLAAIAPVPVMPAYSISKAAALNLTQHFRMVLAPQGISVHAVFLGPVDTDMTRALPFPKTSAEAAARGILDGLERGEEDIFPDPMSQPVAAAWRNGVTKLLERELAAFRAP